MNRLNIWKKYKQKQADKRELEETNYQIVLEDWKKIMGGKFSNKPKMNDCRMTRRESLENVASYITKHPFGKHWHWPILIREFDFLMFYEANKDGRIGEKIRYHYQRERE